MSMSMTAKSRASIAQSKTQQPQRLSGSQPLSATAVRKTAAEPEEIRIRAYHIWGVSGRPPGDGVEFWLKAERELNDQLARRNDSAPEPNSGS